MPFPVQSDILRKIAVLPLAVGNVKLWRFVSEILCRNGNVNAILLVVAFVVLVGILNFGKYVFVVKVDSPLTVETPIVEVSCHVVVHVVVHNRLTDRRNHVTLRQRHKGNFVPTDIRKLQLFNVGIGIVVVVKQCVHAICFFFVDGITQRVVNFARKHFVRAIFFGGNVLLVTGKQICRHAVDFQRFGRHSYGRFVGIHNEVARGVRHGNVINVIVAAAVATVLVVQVHVTVTCFARSVQHAVVAVGCNVMHFLVAAHFVARRQRNGGNVVLVVIGAIGVVGKCGVDAVYSDRFRTGVVQRVCHVAIGLCKAVNFRFILCRRVELDVVAYHVGRVNLHVAPAFSRVAYARAVSDVKTDVRT